MRKDNGRCAAPRRRSAGLRPEPHYTVCLGLTAAAANARRGFIYCVPAFIMLARAGRYFVTEGVRHEELRLDGYGQHCDNLARHQFDRRRRRRPARPGLNRPWRQGVSPAQGSGDAWNPSLHTEVAEGGSRQSTAASKGPPTPLQITSDSRHSPNGRDRNGLGAKPEWRGDARSAAIAQGHSS